ncbi:MAG: hypothetical protein Q8L14_11020 [Myxococcales bacterium]|nr:hypothetical protein [Myxococcales bacterium]
MRISTLPEEDQHALGRELADLALAMGPTWLLDAPILLPRPADFPDQWRPDLDGAELMLERLLTCAGLGEAPFTIDAYENDEALLAGLTGWHRTGGAAAFFAGRRDDGALRFGLDVRQLDDPESLSGVWAHEVAHAFRHVHGLVVADQELEEELTDLTTIALGFGCLTTNNAWRLRRSAELNGAYVRTETRTQRFGYLPLQAMAFALGLEVRLRLISGRSVELRAIRDVLEPAQRETFEATLTLGEIETRALVPIPPPARWRPVTLPQRVAAQALPTLEAPDAEAEAAPEPVIGFRVRQRGAFTPTSLLVTLVSGALAVALWPPWGLAVFLIVPLLIVMKRRSALECSACEGDVDADAHTCARCGAQLVDTIQTRNDRFDAEDRWRKAHDAEPAPAPANR